MNARRRVTRAAALAVAVCATGCACTGSTTRAARIDLACDVSQSTGIWQEGRFSRKVQPVVTAVLRSARPQGELNVTVICSNTYSIMVDPARCASADDLSSRIASGRRQQAGPEALPFGKGTALAEGLRRCVAPRVTGLRTIVLLTDGMAEGRERDPWPDLHAALRQCLRGNVRIAVLGLSDRRIFGPTSPTAFEWWTRALDETGAPRLRPGLIRGRGYWARSEYYLPRGFL